MLLQSARVRLGQAAIQPLRTMYLLSGLLLLTRILLGNFLCYGKQGNVCPAIRAYSQALCSV